ncbi:MAG: DNA recombination protein RmuC [Muribaculaceae bacterium]|nr:DNA recombination protein RmuC [Muribaculaceae bacterium]
MEILLLFIGLAVGAAVGYLIARSRIAALETRVAMLGERHQEALAEQERRFNETMGRMNEQMKNATNEMLKQRQEEFAAASNRDLGLIVTPLRETIENMKKAIDDNTLKHTSLTAEMKTSVESMMRHTQAAKDSTDELARILKHGGKLQGDWGETVLDELLQAQGLTQGIHYDTQATMRDAHGNAIKADGGERMRPDVILHLDQTRDVIIDSKVSLSAFIDYVNAEDTAMRDAFLKAHIESINRHVKELSRKNYSAYVQPPKVKMDYVIMFVPHTGALWTALNAQPDLWRRAMEQNVFIADEQTLYAALRIVSLTWTQITQTQNHERVYALADEMLKRVGQFWKHYEAVGRNLKQATYAYEDARKKITDGGQSINTTARKLQQLGAKANDSTPLPG